MSSRPIQTRAWGEPSRALVAFSALVILLCGCQGKRIPEGKTAVEAVRIEGTPNELDERIEDGLATKASPRLFGIQGVYEYEIYEQAALQKDIERIERQLRRRGYYEARVYAARVIRTKENRVRVEIEIEPGQPVKIRSLKTTGLAQLPFEAAEAATHELRLRAGDTFDEDRFEQAKQDVVNSLSNRGYAFARVSGKAKVDLAANSAHIEIHAEPGERARLGVIRVEGLKKLDQKPVERTLKLKTGALYSRAELRSARAALFSLGVFSTVEIIPDLSDPESRVVPIVVRVEESTLRDITLGLGGRLDLLRLAVVGQVGWTHRNFFGGLRKFSVSTRPGVTFFPTSVDYFHEPTALFPENALTVRLEQPGFIEGRTVGYTQAGYNIYPLLYPLPKGPDHDPRDERVIGYNEITSAVGAERNFWGRLLHLDLSMNWQSNHPFAYQGDASVPGLERVVVAYPELITSVDLRDDPIQPTRGVHFKNSLQSAVPVLGGSVVDVRIKPELATFVPLDQKHKVILATRVGIGMVFPQNYGDALINAGRALDYSDPSVVADQHRLLFRAFYSGGPSSNRGYPYQRIGPQGAIGFLIPNGVSCDPAQGSLPPTCIRPLGGFSLWEASTEIRYRAFKSWSFIAFVDASDVSTQVAHFSFVEPHVAVGPGVRYLSPVGPIRLDLGYRVPKLQRLENLANSSNEPPDISEVPPYSSQDWYQSFALHILIGEAF